MGPLCESRAILGLYSSTWPRPAELEVDRASAHLAMRRELNQGAVRKRTDVPRSHGRSLGRAFAYGTGSTCEGLDPGEDAPQS